MEKAVELNDKQLYKIWKKYINKPIYRVQSDEYTIDMRKNGLNPKKDPFSKTKNKFQKLFEIVLRLERQGHCFILDWGRPVKGSYAVMITSDDLDSPFIDFTIVWKDVIKMNHSWKGGANVSNTKDLCNQILKKDIKLSKKDEKLINYFINWVKDKSDYKNKIISVSGTSKIFETAHFQHHLGKSEKERYWVSPYGRFNHFKKVIVNHGLKRYLPFFKQDKIGHLRVTQKIPKEEIRVLR